MLIAVSQYDEYYSDEGSELELGEADLTKCIQKMLGDVQGVSVIPLSGKWALQTEDLQAKSNISKLRTRYESSSNIMRRPSVHFSVVVQNALT